MASNFLIQTFMICLAVNMGYQKLHSEWVRKEEACLQYYKICTKFAKTNRAFYIHLLCMLRYV